LFRSISTAAQPDSDSARRRARCASADAIGRRDPVTSIRFADRLKNGIRNSEVLIFEGYAHAPLYESVDEFNAKSLQFLQRQAQSVSPGRIQTNLRREDR
jgi:pimeloyl-ACP methyl ester carboxylesterase